MKQLCIILSALFVWLSMGSALASETVVRSAAPGQKIQLDAAPCIRILGHYSPGELRTEPLADGTSELWYTPALDQYDKAKVEVATGGKPTEPKGTCINEINRTYEVTIDHKPKISADATDTAYRVLIVAFVLAVLLESAFELLFNWRLFQEFFVGKAWRTPIMFAVSLWLVHSFKFDLMATLFDAYRGVTKMTEASSGSWLTQAVTAMILGGGSVGVNRILVNLKFRDDIPKVEAERSKLLSKQAYISVLVVGGPTGAQYEVDLKELSDDPNTPMTLGVLRPRSASRIKEIMFPSSLRLPRSGGRLVSTEKVYRIGVKDLATEKFYDMAGAPKAFDELPLMRFAPGAVVDFVVSIPASTIAATS